MLMPAHYTRLQWKNSQPYSEQYDDVFFSRAGGEAESQHVFIAANRLAQRFAGRQHFCIAETGFGSGLNFLLAVQCFLEHADTGASLDFVSVEKHLLHPDDVAQCHADRPHLKTIVDELLRCYPPAAPGMHRCLLFDGRIRLTLMHDDASHALGAVDMQVDAWFLDGFAPSKNQAMWSQPVFDAMARCSHAQTTVSTYTVAGVVRRGLQQAGFEVQKVPGFGDKREMLTARYNDTRRRARQAPWFHLPRSSGDCKQVVIVGAGIAGLATAHQLAQRGCQITLVDRAAEAASAASGNPAAIVMPRLTVGDGVYNAFALQAFYFARQQYRKLQQSSQQPFWFESGVSTAVERERAEKMLDAAHMASAFLRLDSQYATKTERLWLRAEDAGWIRPSLACQQILAVCADSTRYVQAEVASVRAENHRHILLDSEERVIAEADCVVLANAHGLNALLGEQQYPVAANRGQVSLVEERDLLWRLPAPLSADRYITPALEGVACVGASYVDSQAASLSKSDHADNIDGVNSLFDRAIVSESAKQRLEGRVSFRAVTPDRLPMVGPAPDISDFKQRYRDLHHGKAEQNYAPARYRQGLYLNAGYGSHGFSQAFLCAEILASMIANTPAPVARPVLERLLPARFLVRELKRNRPRTDSVSPDRCQ